MKLEGRSIYTTFHDWEPKHSLAVTLCGPEDDTVMLHLGQMTIQIPRVVAVEAAQAILGVALPLRPQDTAGAAPILREEEVETCQT